MTAPLDTCQAYGCHNKAIVKFCGKHEEDAEDGIEIRLKVGRPRKTAPPREPHAPAPRAPRCAARTKKGTETCQNGAAGGSEFCGIHRKLLGVVHA